MSVNNNPNNTPPRADLRVFPAPGQRLAAALGGAQAGREPDRIVGAARAAPAQAAAPAQQAGPAQPPKPNWRKLTVMFCKKHSLQILAAVGSAGFMAAAIAVLSNPVAGSVLLGVIFIGLAVAAVVAGVHFYRKQRKAEADEAAEAARVNAGQGDVTIENEGPAAVRSPSIANGDDRTGENADEIRVPPLPSPLVSRPTSPLLPPPLPTRNAGVNT